MNEEIQFDYAPDRWVILKIGKDVYKLLVSFKGGYLNGDEWRLSSGITNIEDHEKFYIITNESGSIYKCAKRLEGLCSLTSSVFNGFKAKLDGDISIITIEDYNERVLVQSLEDSQEQVS